MPRDMREIIAAVATTAVAVLLTGPIGGLNVTAGQAIALAAGTRHRQTYEDILRRLRRDLKAFARSEHVPDVVISQALSTADLAIRRSGVSVAECIDLQLDPHRIANRVLGRASSLLSDLDEGAGDICRQIVRAVYGEILADADALPELAREFQRHVVGRLAELDRLPEETASAVRSLAAAAAVIDPRKTWRADRFPDSALIRAEFAVVPFHGREDALAEFGDWCVQGPDAAFRLYLGPGGMGKTRLMIEACGRLRARGWRAGFLAGSAPLAWDSLFEIDAPLLITVDYAELQRADLRTLVAHTLGRRGGGRTRLVALARGRGDWWQDLARTGQGVGDFLSGPATSIMMLWPLAETVDQRRDTFERAARSFADRLGRSPPSITPGDLQRDYYDRVLFLHLAALAAVLGNKAQDEHELLDFALRRERGFWDVGVESAGFSDLRGRAVMEAAVVATMAGRIDNRDEAIRLISQVPSLAGQPATAMAAVAELLHELYPGDGWLEGVQPDLLGEHLLYRAGQEDPAILRVFDVG
jgi:hypothetical protein